MFAYAMRRVPNMVMPKREDCTRACFLLPTRLLEAMRVICEAEYVTLSGFVARGLDLQVRRYQEMEKVQADGLAGPPPPELTQPARASA